MATFEQIQKANESIRTMGIERTDKRTGETKVTQYAEVNQRIKAFRMVYPEGFIITEMLSDENGVCKFKAMVGFYDESGEPRIIATGTAYEKESASFINKTSYIENCETSAIGRALGMAGFGIDVSVASYEEVANAMKNQEVKREKMATERQCNYIKENTTAEQLNAILKQKKVARLEDLTEDQAGNICIKLNERKAKELEA